MKVPTDPRLLAEYAASLRRDAACMERNLQHIEPFLRKPTLIISAEMFALADTMDPAN